MAHQNGYLGGRGPGRSPAVQILLIVAVAGQKLEFSLHSRGPPLLVTVFAAVLPWQKVDRAIAWGEPFGHAGPRSCGDRDRDGSHCFGNDSRSCRECWN